MLYLHNINLISKLLCKCIIVLSFLRLGDSSVEMKSVIRKAVKSQLKLLPLETIHDQSMQVFENIRRLEVYEQSNAVSVYVSMPRGEIDTSSIIRDLFGRGKRVFIPKITGKNSADMIMYEVKSMAELESFPKNNWGIPEPDLQAAGSSVDGVDLGIIDLVVIPGVAFDSCGGRLGHGKGYYGTMVTAALTIKSHS